jgi:site-specific recombinase XerD
MPFLISDKGEYLHDLNAWLRSLDSGRTRSFETWTAYARDVLIFLRFLEEVLGKSFWQADADDVSRFHRLRRPPAKKPRWSDAGVLITAEQTGVEVTARSWNRSVAALNRAYRWGQEYGLIEEVPFSYESVDSRFVEHGTATRNLASEGAPDTTTRRFITPEQFLFLREVGFGGYNIDNSLDYRFRGKLAERNVAFLTLLFTTGMRCREATALTLDELCFPQTAASARSTVLRLPPAITKGQKERDVMLAARVQQIVRDYADIERAEAVLVAQKRGTYEEPNRWIVSERQTRNYAFTTVGKQAWDNMSPAFRNRLLIRQEDGTLNPAAIWLSDKGVPLQHTAWTNVFKRAVQRCESFGVRIHATPHVMRHSWGTTLHDVLEGNRLSGSPEMSGPYAAHRHKSPLDSTRTVQRLAGHSQISTTELYVAMSPLARRPVSEATATLAGLAAMLSEGRARQ